MPLSRPKLTRPSQIASSGRNVASGSGADVARSRGFDVDAADLGALRAAAEFRRHREQLQAEQMARLADALPLAQLRLPFVFDDRIGPAGLDVLADALESEVRGLPEMAGIL